MSNRKLKAAIVYRGFYKRKKIRKPDHRKMNNNSFDEGVLENNIKNLLYNYDCDVYMHTYKTNDINDNNMLEVFKKYGYAVKKCEFQVFNWKHHKIGHSIVRSLELVEGEYDIVISIRYDLMFKKDIVSHIDVNKFNIMFKDKECSWDTEDKKVSDLMYVFPISSIESLKEALKEKMDYKDSAGHFVYNSLCNSLGKDRIHFMVDGNYTSNTDLGINPLVKIRRN